MSFDQFARDAAAQKICPPEFTERRFVLGISASPFERSCQRAKRIVNEFVYRSRHIVVRTPYALIVIRMSPTVKFERYPEFVTVELIQVCHDQDWNFPNPFIVKCQREMMAVNQVITSGWAQNDGKRMRVEVVSSAMAMFLSPTPALDIDFTHPHSHLRRGQVLYRDGCEFAHGESCTLRGQNREHTATAASQSKPLLSSVGCRHRTMEQSCSIQIKRRNGPDGG